MRFLPLSLAAGLLAAAPALAQTAAPAPAAAAPATPRYYVGLNAYTNFYQPLVQPAPGLGSLPVPVQVQLVAGYQLRPRLAVQVGLAGGSSRNPYSYPRYPDFPSSTTAYSHEAGSSTWRGLSASVLARYTLTRQLNHRFQADVLGGFTLVTDALRTRGTRTDSLGGSLVAQSYDRRSSGQLLQLTLGSSLRYRVLPGLDLNFDLTLNRALTGSRPTPGYFGGLTTAAALGLRYRFGGR
ncbi:MAG: hypothetical protein M3Y54_19900 [Bacteroidota bacterium]|nr:hypothetical protein [Bacteroidota bacterium]